MSTSKSKPLSSSTDDQSVIEVIKRRIESGSRDDGFCVGLTLEGGGMRGVISGAILLALKDIGASDMIDRFFGTSSGSINLSYFLTGASWDALAVYYDHLRRGNFFAWSRILRREAPLDMDYLFDEVMGKQVPLDYEALVALPDGLLTVTATDVASIESIETTKFRDADEAYNLLKGGAWLPAIAGRPYDYNGRLLLDSGVLLPDPLFATLESNCTHVLVCNTRVQDPASGHSSGQRQLTRLLLDRWSRGLGEEYARRRSRWDHLKAELGYGEAVIGERRVYRLAPSPGSHRVSRLTTDEGALLEGARAGYAAVLEAFGLPADQVHFALVT